MLLKFKLQLELADFKWVADINISSKTVNQIRIHAEDISHFFKGINTVSHRIDLEMIHCKLLITLFIQQAVADV